MVPYIGNITDKLVQIPFLSPRDHAQFDALLGSIAGGGYGVGKTYTLVTTLDKGQRDRVGVMERVLSEAFSGIIRDTFGVKVAYSSIPTNPSEGQFRLAGIQFYEMSATRSLSAEQWALIEILRGYVR